MREPAKLIQGGSTPSGTFILLLPEQTSRDVIHSSNHMYQFHQKIMCNTGKDLDNRYKRVQLVIHRIQMLQCEKQNLHLTK